MFFKYLTFYLELSLQKNEKSDLEGGVGFDVLEEALKIEGGIFGSGGVSFTKSLCPSIDNYQKKPVLFIEVYFQGMAQIKSLLSYKFKYSIYSGKWIVDV